MAFAAVAIFALIGFAIFSLSRIQRSPWTRRLESPRLLITHRQALPRFEFSEGGKRFDAGSFTGRWTLLSFWSSTCAPCLIEMPDLNHLAQSWSGPEFGFVTVNGDRGEDLSLAKAFLSENQISLETIFDQKGELARAFSVAGLPRHFLIDPAGQIVWSESGAFRWTENHTRDQLLRLMELNPDPSVEPPETL